HRLEQIERLVAANLAYDDALRPHAQTVAHEIAHRDLALTFEIRRPSFQTYDVGLLKLQLGGVFASDDALVRIDILGQTIEQGRLAGTGTARDKDVASNASDDHENFRASR